MSRSFITLVCAFGVILCAGMSANAQIQNPYTADPFVSWTTGTPDPSGYWATPVTPNVRFAPGPDGCTVKATLIGNIQNSNWGPSDNEIISGYIVIPGPSFRAELRMSESAHQHLPVPRNDDTTHVFYGVDLRSADPQQFPYVQGAVHGADQGGIFWDGGRYDAHASGTWPDPVQH